MVGKEVVILGSGDIGMIMARRMTLEGAKVVMVVELMDYLAGLTRNRVQCLDDFGIPLKLAHTITAIEGDERVTGVRVAPVDENKKPIMEKSQVIPCDTLLLSVGLIPENELTREAGIPLSDITKGAVVNQYKQTELPYVFACGNVLHVNDLADNVSLESESAGKYAAMYAKGDLPEGDSIDVLPGDGVRYVCPQKVSTVGNEDVTLYFRTILPGRDTRMMACDGSGDIVTRKATCTTPGTMESLTIKAGKLRELTGNVYVSAEHGEVTI
jgi:hypothetical protein